MTERRVARGRFLIGALALAVVLSACGGGSDSTAGITVLHEIDPATTPTDIEIGPDGVYLGDTEAGVVRLDRQSFQPTATGAIAGGTEAIAVGDGVVWGLDDASGAIAPFDPVTLAPLGAPLQVVTPRPADQGHATTTALAALGTSAFAAGDDGLTVADQATGRTGRTDLGDSLYYPYPIPMTAGASVVYVTGYSGLCAHDRAGAEITTRCSDVKMIDVESVAADGDTLYILMDDGRVMVLAPDGSERQLARLSVKSLGVPKAIAAGGGSVWLVGELESGAAAVLRLDPSSGDVTAQGELDLLSVSTVYADAFEDGTLVMVGRADGRLWHVGVAGQ